MSTENVYFSTQHFIHLILEDKNSTGVMSVPNGCFDIFFTYLEML